MAISESDWKTFKELRKIALERFHLGVLSDAKSVTENEALSPVNRYRTLYRLVAARDKDIVRIFEGFSRTWAFDSLALMVAHDLLTDTELALLSEHARAAISYAVRQPYEINWVDEPESAP